jgi:hypothetical protein
MRNSRTGTILATALLSTGLLVASATLHGQATASAVLEGTIFDASQAAVGGSQVMLINKDTDARRTTTSSSTGLYRFDLLPPGHYEIRVTMQGFRTASVGPFELLVSQTSTVNVTLEPGSISETVTVTEEAPIIDVTKTSVGTTFTPSDIQNMPLNGRDFGNLAFLAPGARPVNSYDPTKNRVAVFSIDGSNGRNVNVTVNGIDNKDNSVGGPVMQLPLTAVEEFTISTQRFSAVNGRSEGAAINVITKSGSNKFHGDGYFYDTQTAFNANNSFSEQSHQPTPQFERQQFGGDFGGPIRKDKDFFFAAIEREREHTSIPVTQQAFTELSLLTSIGADPSQVIPTPFFEWRYNGRVDHRFNSNHQLSVSYTGQSNTGLNDQSSQTNDLTAGNFTTNHQIIANATLSSTLGSRVVNALMAGYQYWNNVIDTNKLSPATVNFPNGIYFGTNGNVPQETFQKKWQFKDDVSITHGTQTWKTGFDMIYEPVLGGFFEFNPVPSLTFNDLPDVIINNTNGEYPQGLATPGAVRSMSLAAGDPRFLQKGIKQVGVYFQDDWKVKPRLTLNLGLRWDKDIALLGTSFIPQSRTYQELKAIGSPLAATLPSDPSKDFSPRVGFAYDLTGHGKHIIRGGYGLYFGQLFDNINLFMIQQANPNLFATVFSFTITGPSDPTCTSATPACYVPGTTIPLTQWRYGVDPMPTTPAGAITSLPAGSTGRLINPDYEDPYTQQANIGYSWELNASSVIEVDYIHSLALHEGNSFQVNPVNPALGPNRILTTAFKNANQPVLGSISEASSAGRSRYDGLNVSYRRRMSKRISINTSYVLSKAVGYDGSAANFGNIAVNPFNPFDPNVDYGPVPNDERHRWTFGGVFDLPWGFEAAPFVQFSSARPYNASNGISNFFGYGSGTSAAHDIVPVNNPSDYTMFNSTAYPTSSAAKAAMQACLAAGQCIQAPFDSLRGQAFFQMDARLSKSIHFGERGTLKLIFQGFDITNRANFGNTFGTNPRVASFGQPTGFIAASSVIVPKSFRGEFGVEYRF